MNIQLEYESLKKAIKKNPEIVAQETKNFLYRASIRFESKNASSPWRVGQTGGGSPVATGNLLRSHDSKIEPFKLTYFQNDRKADYGVYVHKKRPWLDWVENQSKAQINQDAERLLKNVTDALGDK